MKQQVVAWLEKNGGKEDGISEENLKEHFGESRMMSQVINLLSETDRLEIVRSADGMRYKLKDIETSRAGSGEASQEQSILTNEQMIVLQVVRASGTSGVWLRDIKNATSLQQQTLNKTLKLLETRKFVKIVKSVQQKTKKLYMAFELEPTRDISGGPWYTDQEFDTEFVTEIQKVIMQFIKQKKIASAIEVDAMLKSIKAFKVHLEFEDVQLVINSLIFDNKIERYYQNPFDDASIKYKAVTEELSIGASFPKTVPCATCPVRSRCSSNGLISPDTCIYFDRWLENKEAAPFHHISSGPLSF
eukprot:CAMPEP_0197319580 /NCGR_PEP_ID=MMETSP0891-20130614/55520_1 /TAXON_ID=44058 ORGANISM="Aureoumbra lagunensis, Strain CCMP1510" /NCGR_SAMPLE_ID=MMETSP0891 /ASSEMBLY_ACC=CAM_ASM_000534 /LENGTH=302 /DNA_ID=CAMNT_0042810591 /DNA_START=84 /DNA_END=992 /DNA_ORIENTATION=-